MFFWLGRALNDLLAACREMGVTNSSSKGGCNCGKTQATPLFLFAQLYGALLAKRSPPMGGDLYLAWRLDSKYRYAILRWTAAVDRLTVAIINRSFYDAGVNNLRIFHGYCVKILDIFQKSC